MCEDLPLISSKCKSVTLSGFRLRDHLQVNQCPTLGASSERRFGDWRMRQPASILFFVLSLVLAGCGGSMVSRTGAGVLQVLPGSVAFGGVSVGQTASTSISLVNNGSSAIDVSNLNVAGQSFSVNGESSLPVTVAAGGSYSLKVKFKPAAIGPAAGQLTVTSNSSVNATAAIALSGTGTANRTSPGAASSTSGATAAISRNAHGVTDVGTTATASPITVPLSGVAAGDLIVCEVSLNQTSGGVTFTSVSDPYNGTYSPVTHLHTNSGTERIIGTYAVANAVAGSYSVSLAWTGGAQPYMAMACQSWTGVATSAPQDTSMTEALDGVSAGNAAAGQLLTPAVPGELVIGNLVTATQVPTAGANYSLTDSATTSHLWPEYWVQTTATATNAPYTNSADNWSEQMVAFIPLGSTVPPPPAPAITSADGASGAVGNAFAYQIAATNMPTSFGATGLPAGLTVNTSTGLISGTPTAGGTSTVKLSATNSGGTGNANLTLIVASETAVLSINSSSLAFGDVTLDTPATQSVTLTSSGTAAVTVNSATVSGTGFSISGVTFPLTLNPNQTATLNVQFDPTAAGAVTGQLIITSNSSTNGTASISLSGTGQATSYEVNLTWNAPTGSTDPVAGYNIYRATNGSSSYVLLNPKEDTLTSYSDTTVASSTSYTYYVESVDASGNASAPSNSYTVNVP